MFFRRRRLVTEFQRHGAYVRYTDDFLLFGNDKRRLWESQSGIRDRLMPSVSPWQSRNRAFWRRGRVCRSADFAFSPGLRPRVLGATKRNSASPIITRHNPCVTGKTGTLSSRLWPFQLASHTAVKRYPKTDLPAVMSSSLLIRVAVLVVLTRSGPC